MKKKEWNVEKSKTSEDASHYEMDQEDILDLNSLMDVQGGQNDDKIKNCGLGCFSGAVYQQDDLSSQETDEKG